MLVTGEDGADILSRGYYNQNGFTFFVLLNSARQVVEVITMDIPDLTDSHLNDWNSYLGAFGIDVNGQPPDFTAPCAVYWDAVNGKSIGVASVCAGGEDRVNSIKISDVNYSMIRHR